MNPTDFVVCIAFAAMSAASLWLGWYPLSIFAAMVFILVLANVCLFHVQMPQPRWIIGIGVPRKKDEEPEEDTETE